MGRRFRIRVYATPRLNPDSKMLAQVVIALGRHLAAQRKHQQGRKDS